MAQVKFNPVGGWGISLRPDASVAHFFDKIIRMSASNPHGKFGLILI